MPILWKRLASGFAVAALFVAFARNPGFDWVPLLPWLLLHCAKNKMTPNDTKRYGHWAIANKYLVRR